MAVTLTENDDGTYVLNFKQGARAAFHFNVFTDASKKVGANLEGYKARGMGREKYGAISIYPKKFDILCSIDGIKVSCVINPTDSAANDKLSGVFDVEIYDPEDDENVLECAEGIWIMRPEATV